VKRQNFFLWTILVLGVLLLPDTLLGQCALCKSALVDSPEGRQLAAGFNRGILFLASIPFLTVGAIGLLVLQSRRREASDPLTKSPDPVTVPEGIRVEAVEKPSSSLPLRSDP